MKLINFRPVSTGKTGASRTARYTLPLLILCGVLWMVACNSLSKYTSHSNGSSSPPDGSAQATASPFERQLQLTSTRTVKYANLQFTVTRAVISNRAPDNQPVDDANPAFADITLSVVNTQQGGVGIRDALWQLQLGDDSVYKQTYSDNLGGRDTKERKISFRVPMAAQWNGAQLTLDEQGKEPATILLDGTAPPPRYPTTLSQGGEANTKGPAMTYTILSANVDVDSVGERAALDKRYLNLSVRVADKDTESAGQFLPEFFRLVVNGSPSTSENMSENNIINPQSSQDITMSYVIPANATSVELEVGKPDIQETARIPIDLRTVKKQ
jgi:hypothetical protein